MEIDASSTLFQIKRADALNPALNFLKYELLVIRKNTQILWKISRTIFKGKINLSYENFVKK